MTEQITAERLALLTPEEIKAAFEAGMLDALLGREPEPETAGDFDDLKAKIVARVGVRAGAPTPMALNGPELVEHVKRALGGTVDDPRT